MLGAADSQHGVTLVHHLGRHTACFFGAGVLPIFWVDQKTRPNLEAFWADGDDKISSKIWKLPRSQTGTKLMVVPSPDQARRDVGIVDLQLGTLKLPANEMDSLPQFPTYPVWMARRDCGKSRLGRAGEKHDSRLLLSVAHPSRAYAMGSLFLRLEPDQTLKHWSARCLPSLLALIAPAAPHWLPSPSPCPIRLRHLPQTAAQ